ncbi:neurogenic locus notch-like protein 1 [Trichonephila clavipes]|uniref:Neurogenic locus notch-like protein 1 n=1 Tax=Trichonephila clavipes TaxID=2585209 RepID=A0A8X6SM42_TRICX|nr:neurogenic locus notch-like protein 1 [Trichonephila clavipes]
MKQIGRQPANATTILNTQDICDIEENQKQCSVLGAECDVSTNGRKTCKCPPFFQPFANGTACDKSASFSYLLTLPLNSASYKRKEVIDTRNRRSAEILYSHVDYDSVQSDVLKSVTLNKYLFDLPACYVCFGQCDLSVTINLRLLMTN